MRKCGQSSPPGLRTSVPPRLFQADLRLRPADQRGPCSSRQTRHRQTSGVLRVVGPRATRHGFVPVPKRGARRPCERMCSAKDHRDPAWLSPMDGETAYREHTCPDPHLCRRAVKGRQSSPRSPTDTTATPVVTDYEDQASSRTKVGTPAFVQRFSSQGEHRQRRGRFYTQSDGTDGGVPLRKRLSKQR